MPLELTRSPDHCTICLELTIPNTAAGSAQQVQRVKVYCPFGKAGTEAYRLQVAHADPQFADMLQGMTEGRITLESAVSDISRILKACCAKAMSGNSQPQPRSGQGAPWFDDECHAACEDFRRAWATYTALRNEQNGLVAADHPFLIAAHEARRTYPHMS